MALFYWCINSFFIPNLGDITSTSFGERSPFRLLDFCSKQSNMATVQSLSADDFSQVEWQSSAGTIITFKLTTTAHLTAGKNYLQTGSSCHHNTQFPTDIPELHIDIEEGTNGNGLNPLILSGTIPVTMANIHEPVTIKLIIKENGNTEGESVYQENPDHIERPHNQRPFGY